MFQSTLQDKLQNWDCKKESFQCQNKNKGLASLKRSNKLFLHFMRVKKSVVYSQGRKIELVSIRLPHKTKIKIGFSTFALLRLKWCIPVSAAGTHNVCVCTYHQKVKLMLVAMNSSSNYRQIIKLCVCDVDKYDCMMGHCDNCLDLSLLKVIFEKRVVKNNWSTWDNPDETIQWVSNDRSQLVEVENEFDDSIESLVGKFRKLTKHHYIAKKQAEFFKQFKENLQFGECVIVLDFAENYSFLIQDAAQGFHWSNSQSTIHSFVIYYVDGSAKLAHKSYACIRSQEYCTDQVTITLMTKLLPNWVTFIFPSRKIVTR